MDILYCTNCKRYIKPLKKFNVPLAVILYIITGGVAFWIYLLYYIFRLKPQCPICENKNLLADRNSITALDESPKVTTEEGANIKRMPELPAKSLSSAVDKIDKHIERTVIAAEPLKFQIRILLRQIFGYILLIFGIFLSAICLVGLTGKTSRDLLIGLILLFLIGLPSLLGGFSLLKNAKTIKEKEKHEAIERKILDIASSKDGEISAVDIARNTNLSIQEAESYLDKIELQGYAMSYLSKDGSIRYKISC